MRGGSRVEDYELVFVSIPPAEWDKGPGAANAWIRDHLPLLPDEAHNRAEPEITDKESLKAWLEGRDPEVALVAPPIRMDVNARDPALTAGFVSAVYRAERVGPGCR